jgi:hypothetical protein
LTATGTGGLDELKEKLDDNRASFAYARVQYSNDKESQREKFILIIWIGPNCKVMRKAKVHPPFHGCKWRVSDRIGLLPARFLCTLGT